jgi:serine/threonine protein kinase
MQLLASVQFVQIDGERSRTTDQPRPRAPVMSFEHSPTLILTSVPDSAHGAGSLIGAKYRLEQLLGEGGMGAVWRARNVLLDLPVAVKLLHPQLRSNDTSTRLLNEARVEAKLRHPSIVRVFDYGETECGEAYIAMELIEGSSLGDLLDQHGTLPAKLAVRLMLPVIHGLCAVHRAGVVHRDVKPENIVVAESGPHLQPKLLDFGIAKLRDSRLTIDGSLLGSPAYMAPEQARGSDDVDQRADVWALCIVLYELIAGTNPFAGGNPYAVLRAVVEREPPPLNVAGCAKLWPILRRGLAKDRDARTASACELGEALARWLIAEGEHEDACGEPLARNWEVSTKHAAADSGIRAKPLREVRSTSDRNLSGARVKLRALAQAAAVCLLATAFAWLLASSAATRERASTPPTRPASANYADAFASTSPAPASLSSEPAAGLESLAIGTVASSTPTTLSRSAAPSSTVVAKRSERSATEAELGLKDPFR